jgi:hypothetical protein
MAAPQQEADDVTFAYAEQDGEPAVSVACAHGSRPELRCRPMAQLEPLVYSVLCDCLPADAAAAQLGCHDGSWSAMVGVAMRNRGKAIRFHCQDAMHPNFDAVMRGWGVEYSKGAPPPARPPVDCGMVDATRLSPDHVGAAVRHMAGRVGEAGWVVVRGSAGRVAPAVQAALADAGMRAVMIEQPYAYNVSVCHRDACALEDFGAKLAHVLDMM